MYGVYHHAVSEYAGTNWIGHGTSLSVSGFRFMGWGLGAGASEARWPCAHQAYAGTFKVLQQYQYHTSQYTTVSFQSF
jgi:hypothetical protein